MPRSPILPATLILATVTALTLLAAAVSIRPAQPAPAVAVTDGTSRRAVRAFYEAVNSVIATGDPESLTAVLSPDFAELDGDGALVPGRTGLERSLLALHATAPALRLVADQVIGDADRVVAVVQARGVEETPVFGLPLIDHPWWSPIEIFRVVDGRVAERSGPGGRPVLLEPLVNAPVMTATPARLIVTGVHVTVEPDTWHRAPAIDGLRVLVVEGGALDVTVAASDLLAGMPSSYHAILGTGDRLVLSGGSAGSAYEAHNVDRDPAVFIEVLATTATTSRFPVHRSIEGAGSWESAGTQTPLGVAGSAELTIGRATLAPGGRLAWTGPAVLLWVERGTLELRADDAAFTWVWRQSGVATSHGRSTTLSAGDAGRLGERADVEIRNSGNEPLDVLIVTLLGTPGETATPSPSLPPLPPLPGLIVGWS